MSENAIDLQQYREAKEELEKLLEQEKSVIEEITKKGFKNPKENTTLNLNLEFAWDGKKYRRFMCEFGYVDLERLKESQVRKSQYDEDYCKEKLVPLLQKEGLQYPIFTSNSAQKQDEEIEAGHNRSYSWEIINGRDDVTIPRILISEPHFLNKENGQLESITMSQLEFLKEVSRISSNGPVENNPYTMECVSYQIKSLFAKDPTLGGINPSRIWFKNKDCPIFHKLMDNLHPRQFLLPGTRTTIFNKMARGNTEKEKNVNKDVITSELNNLGWDPSLRMNQIGKTVRKGLLESFDKNTNAYIGVVQNVTTNFDTTVLVPMVKKVGSGENFESKDIFLHCKVRSGDFHGNKKSLDTARSNFINYVLDYNQIADKLDLPKVQKIFFPKQLQVPSDKGGYYHLGTKQENGKTIPWFIQQKIP